MNNSFQLLDEINVAITICDADAIIVAMNDKSIKTFEKYGGKSLIGSNLLDCHSESSRAKIIEMMEHHTTNAYTIEKEGKKKLIYQTPCFENGAFAGFAEFSLELPEDMPHFIRQ